MEHEQEPGVGQDAGTPGEPGERGAEADRPADGDAGHGSAGVRERTGDSRVDAAIRTLGGLDKVPVSEHQAIFEHIHGRLVEVLGELHAGTERPGTDAAGRDLADRRQAGGPAGGGPAGSDPAGSG